MKLRIARKMDQKPKHYPGYRKDKRVWWKVYSVEQLKRAEIRLHKSWRTACPLHVVPELDNKLARDLTPDFFRGNRVNSRRIRQAELRRTRR